MLVKLAPGIHVRENEHTAIPHGMMTLKERISVMQSTDVQTIATLLGIAVMLVGIVLTSNHRLANAFKEQTAENKTRFDRVDERLDAMNQDMNQRFERVDERFDAMNQDMNQRFDAMNREINLRFDGVYGRIDALRGDINHDVNKRFDTMNRDVNDRLDTLNRAAQPPVTDSNSQKRQAVG